MISCAQGDVSRDLTYRRVAEYDGCPRTPLAADADATGQRPLPVVALEDLEKAGVAAQESLFDFDTVLDDGVLPFL